MSSYDAADFNVKHRHCRLFLVDLAVIFEGGRLHHTHGIDFMDSLDDVIKKEGKDFLLMLKHHFS